MRLFGEGTFTPFGELRGDDVLGDINSLSFINKLLRCREFVGLGAKYDGVA